MLQEVLAGDGAVEEVSAVADNNDAEPFSSFMQRALYDPRTGYYSRRISTVGARGDFSTSVTVSGILGIAIASWLMQESRLQPRVRHVIEVGGGDGSLMRAVQTALGWWKRRRFIFHLVETSPVLRDRQAQTLRGASVRWHETLEEALQAASGAAFLFHNELLDAFPVARVRWDAMAGRWREVWVRFLQDGGAKEEGRICERDPELYSVLREWHKESPPPHPNQTCELQAGVLDWLHDWSREWKSGAMLTIDYGDLLPLLYRRRPAGTLRAYLLHQRIEGLGIYENVGRQDLTCDINFTDYRAWCAALGWHEAAWMTQAAFLKGNVSVRDLARDRGTAFLVDPEGAGGAFKCLVHRPGGGTSKGVATGVGAC